MAGKTKKTNTASKGRGSAAKMTEDTQRTARTPAAGAARKRKKQGSGAKTKTLSNEIKGIVLIALGIFWALHSSPRQRER